MDVIVTDGFTGNVALKTLEGALKFMFSTIAKVIGTDEATKAAGDVLLAHLLPIAAELDPDTHGGAILLGVDGVSVISHGSSSARRSRTRCASLTTSPPAGSSTPCAPRSAPRESLSGPIRPR